MHVDEPDVAYGYTTGWEIDTAFDARYLRGIDDDESPADIGGSANSGYEQEAAYNAIPQGTGASINALMQHYHDGIKPAYIAVNIIKWVGFV
jgi:hypothetical protein